MNNRDRNPLCEVTHEIPFNSISAEHVEPALTKLLDESKQRVDAILKIGSTRTFENTILALEDATKELQFSFGIVSHLESSCTTPALRAAFNKVEGVISEFFTSLILNEPLWNAVHEYANSEEAKRLPPISKRLLSRTVTRFKREGALLGVADKARLAEINRHLTELTTKFSQNLIDATKEYELVITDESKLAGLPARAKEFAYEGAKKKGLTGWRFTLQEPSIVPVLMYLDDAKIRETIWRAYGTLAGSGPSNNSEIIERILSLRAEKSKLLGFQNFADYVLEERMAKSAQGVKRFLSELTEKVKPFAEKEHADLYSFRRQLEGVDAKPLEPWDVAYYAEKQRQALYKFDQEETRPYFEVEAVLQGVFELANALFGVKISSVSNLPVWDPAVRSFKIEDHDGVLLGYFHVDSFPRENKRSGAWMNGLLIGQPRGASHLPHVGLFAGNFSPAVGSLPALLTHSEVETIFHEFGHLLHHLLTEVEFRSLAGTNVEWDFVELPSQILENWCWEPEILNRFARHFESGQQLPAELLELMLKARNFRSGSFFLRQLGLSTVDLMLHTEYRPGQGVSAVEFARKIQQDFSFVKLPENYSWITSFGHLFSDPVGYAAGYYSYKWAEVLEADAYTQFQKAGILNRKVGDSFRNCILARGDSEPPDVLFKKFMGRDPDAQALLKRSGLHGGA